MSASPEHTKKRPYDTDTSDKTMATSIGSVEKVGREERTLPTAEGVHSIPFYYLSNPHNNGRTNDHTTGSLNSADSNIQFEGTSFGLSVVESVVRSSERADSVEQATPVHRYLTKYINYMACCGVGSAIETGVS